MHLPLNQLCRLYQYIERRGSVLDHEYTYYGISLSLKHENIKKITQWADVITSMISCDDRHCLKELENTFRASIQPQTLKASSCPVDTHFYDQGDSVIVGPIVYQSGVGSYGRINLSKARVLVLKVRDTL